MTHRGHLCFNGKGRASFNPPTSAAARVRHDQIDIVAFAIYYEQACLKSLRRKKT
jgi:hypothetical protein